MSTTRKEYWFSNHRNGILHLFDVAIQIGSGKLKHPCHPLVVKNYILSILEPADKTCDCADDEEHSNFIKLSRLFLNYIENKDMV